VRHIYVVGDDGERTVDERTKGFERKDDGEVLTFGGGVVLFGGGERVRPEGDNLFVFREAIGGDVIGIRGRGRRRGGGKRRTRGGRDRSLAHALESRLGLGLGLALG
jgi:hypothetical protein